MDRASSWLHLAPRPSPASRCRTIGGDCLSKKMQLRQLVLRAVSTGDPATPSSSSAVDLKGPSHPRYNATGLRIAYCFAAFGLFAFVRPSLRSQCERHASFLTTVPSKRPHCRVRTFTSDCQTVHLRSPRRSRELTSLSRGLFRRRRTAGQRCGLIGLDGRFQFATAHGPGTLPNRPTRAISAG